MPLRRAPTRYYVHGDLHEDRANTYYCAYCDAFVAPGHFSDPHHIQSREKKFKASLDAWHSYMKKRGANFYRPVNSKNIIQADSTADTCDTKTMQSPFYRWLLRQRRRNDPIGDLAADASADKSFPADTLELRSLKHHLVRQAAAPKALVALDEAWREFKAKGKARSGLTSSQRFEVFKRDGYRCQICGAKADNNRQLEVDHKVPVAKGGSNELSNLWTLCFDCNRGKSDHDL